MNYPTATPRVASFIIIRKGNKVAFVLRGNIDYMAHHYGLPSGKLEKDETCTQAAVREAKEEIGITIAENDLTFAHVVHRSEGSDWIDMYFEVAKWEGEPHNAEPEKHDELAWLDNDNLPDNVVPAVKIVLEKIAKGEVFSQYGWQDSKAA
jgi:mutator protein MutT